MKNSELDGDTVVVIVAACIGAPFLIGVAAVGWSEVVAWSVQVGVLVGGSEQPLLTIPGMGGAGLDQTRLIVVGGLLMSLLICTGALIRRRWIEWRSVQ